MISFDCADVCSGETKTIQMDSLPCKEMLVETNNKIKKKKETNNE